MKQGKAKIRIFFQKDVVKVKMLIANLMLTEEQAKRKGIKQDYITHIVLTANDQVIFEFKPTPYVSRNPSFTFFCPSTMLHAGDHLTLIWKTSLGETYRFTQRAEER